MEHGLVQALGDTGSNCPFGDDAALLSGLEKYESTRSFWMSGCLMTTNACRSLASKVPR